MLEQAIIYQRLYDQKGRMLAVRESARRNFDTLYLIAGTPATGMRAFMSRIHPGEPATVSLIRRKKRTAIELCPLEANLLHVFLSANTIQWDAAEALLVRDCRFYELPVVSRKLRSQVFQDVTVPYR